MTRTLVLLLTSVVFVAMAMPIGADEAEQDFYFPLAQGIYKENETFSEGSKIIILPGEVERIKVGKKYPFFDKKGTEYVQSGVATVTGVNEWESNAVVSLMPGFALLNTKTMVRVSVQVDRCFAKWMENAANYEKVSNWYLAFAAYYRAHLYKPLDDKVYNAYLRTGYLYWLKLGNEAFAKQDYRTAAEKFGECVKFRWPGGDISEGEKKLAFCNDYMSRIGAYDEYMKAAAQARSARNYYKAMEQYRLAWMQFVSATFGETQKKACKAGWFACFDEAYGNASVQTDQMIKDGMASDAYLSLLKYCRFLPYLEEDRNANLLVEKMRKVAGSLPVGSLGFALHRSLLYLATSQVPSGAIVPADSAKSAVTGDIMTGLALVAFARNGSTAKGGVFKDCVAKCMDYALKNGREDGSLGVDARSSSHIALLWGITEQWLATGDTSLTPRIQAGFKHLWNKLSDSGHFGEPAAGVDLMFDTAIIGIALRTASDNGVESPGYFYERLNEIAMGRMQVSNKLIIDSTGRVPAPGSPEEIFHYGAVLALIRSAGKPLLTNDTFNFIVKSREFRPSIDAVTPEGWLFNLWAWQAFPSDQWTGYRDALRSTICSGTANGDSGNYAFPVPRGQLYRLLGEGQAAAFNAISVSYILSSSY